jgi:hypothetical protein
MKCLLQIAESLATMLDASCDFTADDPTFSNANVARMQRHSRQHIKILALAELEFPESEFAIYLHETAHLGETIMYWNSPRNYWCFITERFVGFCKGFVKNRSLAVENLVRCHTYVNSLVNFCFDM